MLWLFGQIWLWLLVAFVLGAASAALLLRVRPVAPAAERPGDIEDHHEDEYPPPAERRVDEYTKDGREPGVTVEEEPTGYLPLIAGDYSDPYDRGAPDDSAHNYDDPDAYDPQDHGPETDPDRTEVIEPVEPGDAGDAGHREGTLPAIPAPQQAVDEIDTAGDPGWPDSDWPPAGPRPGTREW